MEMDDVDPAVEELEPGDVFLFFCPDGSGPPVVATVGRIESGIDLGLHGSRRDVVTAHVSMVSIPGLGPDQPVRWSHAPFLLEALTEAPGIRIARGVPPLDGFEEGYTGFRRELDGGGAGFFTESPARLVWLTFERLRGSDA
jgi:hypothetical protein